jgi:hypothetical protein
VHLVDNTSYKQSRKSRPGEEKKEGKSEKKKGPTKEAEKE